MKFKEYKYTRPDYEVIKKEYLDMISNFRESQTAEEQYLWITKINELDRYISTMAQLVAIRNSINSSDEFYDKENEYIDMITPMFQGLRVEFYKELLKSPFRKEIQEKVLPQLFTLAEMEIKIFDDSIIPLLQEENKLISEYSKLTSSAKIEYEGKILNLSQMGPYMESKNREIRKKAYEKYISFFEKNEEKFDNIYDKLVHVRNEMAIKLGFKNYVELGYLKMSRSDYNWEDVKKFRDNIVKHIVPFANEIRKKQAKRINIEDFKYYDIPLNFISGNPSPKGNKEWMLEKARNMYEELSPETNEFINFMIEKDLLDLDAKPNKQPGGYCTYLYNYNSPFIFSNFNGTSDDVTVLTHEAGHAFQTYESRHFDCPEYSFPTLEACEIHSMGMEFLTWPWMETFFQEDVDKFKYLHLTDAMVFIPYGATVDEFQHIIYENPNITPDERKSIWRELEKKYTPYKDYDNNSFLEKGTFWFKQGHIFSSPFYYIDYTLAQICAYQYWIKSEENRKKAWKDYLNICKVGGSQPFMQILKSGNLKSPFEEETIIEVIAHIKEYVEYFSKNI